MDYRTISRALAMVALTMVAAMAVSPALASPRTLDRGGRIDAYAARIAAARGLHRISGDCYSACTMWVAYHHSCITRDARLWFHGAFDIGREGVIAPDGNALMASYYPPPVRSIVSPWLDTLNFSKAHSLSGAQLIAMGMRPCR